MKSIPQGIIQEISQQKNHHFPVVVADVDGTILDDTNGLSEYYDGIPKVIQLLRELSKDHRIIILTMRPTESTIATRRNLRQLGVPYHRLVMNRYNEDPSFKQEYRKKLEETGHKVVMTIGDKMHDLRGHGALKILVVSSQKQSSVTHELYKIGQSPDQRELLW